MAGLYMAMTGGFGEPEGCPGYPQGQWQVALGTKDGRRRSIAPDNPGADFRAFRIAPLVDPIPFHAKRKTLGVLAFATKAAVLNEIDFLPETHFPDGLLCRFGEASIERENDSNECDADYAANIGHGARPSVRQMLP
ncbi:MAG: hypothetical protein ACXWJW_15830 [Xanthobacteraceae bacterium]